MDGSPIDVMQKIEKTVNNSHATLNKSEPTIVSVGPREKNGKGQVKEFTICKS